MNTAIIRRIMLIGLMPLIVACATRPLPPPQWVYEKEALAVHLKADPRLNLRDGAAHTLLVCVYQLKDPNTFQQLASDLDGLYRLLECSLFDSSVAVSKRLILQPGEQLDLRLDRAEGARYVAVVAGYYVIEKPRIVRFYTIPTAVKKQGFIRRTKTQIPAALEITLDLGPEQITTPQGE